MHAWFNRGLLCLHHSHQRYRSSRYSHLDDKNRPHGDMRGSDMHVRTGAPRSRRPLPRSRHNFAHARIGRIGVVQCATKES